MHENDALEPSLREAVEAYHQPPPTPRRELWLQIQHARAIRQGRMRRQRTFHPLIWGTGVAALLAIGVGLGRLSVKHQPPAATPEPEIAAAGVPADASAYRTALVEHLRQTEVFLTLFRMSVRRRELDPLVLDTARPLLATDRILLDSPAGADPKARKLLQDLEFVLAQIAQLSPRPMPEDLTWIETGIEQTAIMTRLSNKMPAGI